MDTQTILVVEDDEATLETIRAVLEEVGGVQVALAADGEEALWRVSQAQPALVVVDLMMPGVDGVELCRRLKADAATRGTPVLMLSAAPAEYAAMRAADAGCDAFVAKPFDAEHLVGEVRRLLGRTG